MDNNHFLCTQFIFHDESTRDLISEVVSMLTEAYFAELETAMNYIALRNNLSGIDGEQVKQILDQEIQDEFNHAQALANRIRVLGFQVPNSNDFRSTEQSPAQLSLGTGISLRDAVRQVIEAESEAMNLYKRIIDKTAEHDPVTADLVTDLLADEEDHFRTFTKFRSNN